VDVVGRKPIVLALDGFGRVHRCTCNLAMGTLAPWHPAEGFGMIQAWQFPYEIFRGCSNSQKWVGGTVTLGSSGRNFIMNDPSFEELSSRDRACSSRACQEELLVATKLAMQLPTAYALSAPILVRTSTGGELTEGFTLRGLFQVACFDDRHVVFPVRQTIPRLSGSPHVRSDQPRFRVHG
jgi:hypothetical protein